MNSLILLSSSCLAHTVNSEKIATAWLPTLAWLQAIHYYITNYSFVLFCSTFLFLRQGLSMQLWCPGTHSVGQADLDLRESACLWLWNKRCAPWRSKLPFKALKEVSRQGILLSSSQTLKFRTAGLAKSCISHEQGPYRLPSPIANVQLLPLLESSKLSHHPNIAVSPEFPLKSTPWEIRHGHLQACPIYCQQPSPIPGQLDNK